MSKNKISDIEKKKQELEAELERIQNGLDKSLVDVKGEMIHSLKPKEIIQKYPLPIMAASVALGFLIGKPKSSGKSESDSGKSISGMVGSELKSILTKRAIRAVMKLIDEQIDSKKSSD